MNPEEKADQNVKLALMQRDLQYIKQSMDEFKTTFKEKQLADEKRDEKKAEELELNYVRKDDFDLIKKLVYGTAGTVLLAALNFAIQFFTKRA